jgi:hypothetical protein
VRWSLLLILLVGCSGSCGPKVSSPAEPASTATPSPSVAPLVPKPAPAATRLPLGVDYEPGHKSFVLTNRGTEDLHGLVLESGAHRLKVGTLPAGKGRLVRLAELHDGSGQGVPVEPGMKRLSATSPQGLWSKRF